MMDPTIERELREGFFAQSAPDRGLYGRRRIEFTVIGVAQQKGSAKAFPFFAKNHHTGERIVNPKTGEYVLGATVTSDNPNLKEWQHSVAEGARRALAQLPEHEQTVLTGPVALDVLFDLPRPQSLPKKVTAHVKKPDLDKLARGVKDALSKILWRDDSQVTELRARKRYAEANQPASCRIAVEG